MIFCFYLVIYKQNYKACLKEQLEWEEMESTTRFQILDESVCSPFRTNALEKDMNPNSLPGMGIWQDKIGL